MKKLAIVLVDSPTASGYLPGDSIAGHLLLDSSSSLKYTCLKIRFVGLVSTKIAKASEALHVLNQQLVLLGNPNNATELPLPQGKHSWPFEFTVPYQHIPSSGKYRHGTVTYTLAAALCSKTFLGGIHETKANHAIHLNDLVNCAQEPFSCPLSITGSSNIKPATNKAKNLASATMHLTRSAYMHGQLLRVAINLRHPRDIQRDPGCWIQLVRQESYLAGKYKKEYTHVVTTSSHPVSIDSNTGDIVAELTIPDNAPPTMNTTKIISIQYHLLLLFDMRARTGFLERRSRRKVDKNLRSKLFASPGGFEVQIPIIIGTISDSNHTRRLSPFAHSMGTDTDMDGKVASVAAAVSQLSLSTASNGAILPPVPVAASNLSTPSFSSSGSSTSPAALYHQISPYSPQTQHKASGYSTLPAYSRQASEPNYHSMSSKPPTMAFGSGDRSRTLSSHPSTSAVNIFARPLPALPSTSTHFQPPYLASAAVYGSSEPALTPADHSSQPLSSISSAQFIPSYPSEVRYAPVMARVGLSEGSSSLLRPNEYLQEKAMSLPSSYLHMQPPSTPQVSLPTAPQALDLGIGPESPGTAYRRISQTFCPPDTSSRVVASSRGDYFDHRAPQSLPGTRGAALHNASAPHLPSMANMTPAVFTYQGAPALAHSTSVIQYPTLRDEAAPPYTRSM